MPIHGAYWRAVEVSGECARSCICTVTRRRCIKAAAASKKGVVTTKRGPPKLHPRALPCDRSWPPNSVDCAQSVRKRWHSSQHQPTVARRTQGPRYEFGARDLRGTSEQPHNASALLQDRQISVRLCHVTARQHRQAPAIAVALQGLTTCGAGVHLTGDLTDSDFHKDGHMAAASCCGRA